MNSSRPVLLDLRVFIPLERALALLPIAEHVHVIQQGSTYMRGAYWPHALVVQMFHSHAHELQQAGLCALDSCYSITLPLADNNVLFFETVFGNNTQLT
jgi:hypothetical protein